MATVSTQYPTTNAAETGAGLTNPTNAYADDTSYATGAPGKNTTLATKYGNFGFDAIIPSGATITKVQIIELHKVSTTSSVATCRTYTKVGGSAGSNHDDATEPAADTTKTYDVTAERSWTRANLLDGTLEVVLAAVQGSSGTAVTMSFDFVKVEVTWEASPTTALNTPADAGTVTTTTPTLNFTGTDPNGDNVEYEVQIDPANTFDSGAQNSTTTDDTFYGTSFSAGPNDTATTLSFGGWGDAYYDFLKFDISSLPASNVTQQVLLYLYVGGPSVNDAVCQVRRVTSTWAGSTLTRTNLPTVDTANFGSLPTVGGGSARWISVDITTLYKAWKDGTYTNYGVQIFPTVTSNQNNGSFHSKENASGNAPYIRVIKASIDKLSTADTGFTAGHPFASGAAKDFTVQSGDALTNTASYYWRARAIDPTGSNAYGAWATARSFTVNSATQVSITKSLQYTIDRTISAVTKSLKYTLKITQSAITKSLRYAVKLTPSATTKSLQYVVHYTPSAIGKSLKYEVHITQTAITKSLFYALVRPPSAMQKDLAYVVVQIVSEQKTLGYDVLTQSQKTKSLTYTVLGQSSVTKSLTYAVYVATSVTKGLQYLVNATHAAVTKTLEYALVMTPSPVTKDLGYAVVVPEVVTKSLQYYLNTTSTLSTDYVEVSFYDEVTLTLPMQYAVVAGGTGATKSLAYAVRTTSSVTKGLQYEVQVIASLTKGLQYAVHSVPAATTKSLGYAVLTSLSTTKGLQYEVATVGAITKSARYAVKKTAAITKSARYEVKTTPAAVTKSLQYEIKVVSNLTKTLTYAIKTTPAKTKSLAYHVLEVVGLSKSLTYVVVLRTTLTSSLTYHVAYTQPFAVTKVLRYVVNISRATTKALTYAILRDPYHKDGHYSRGNDLYVPNPKYVRTASRVTKRRLYTPF